MADPRSDLEPPAWMDLADQAPPDDFGEFGDDFAEAFAVQQTVDAVKESSRREAWVDVSSI